MVNSPCNICNGSSFSIVSSVAELFMVRISPIIVPIGGARENIIIDRKYCAIVACKGDDYWVMHQLLPNVNAFTFVVMWQHFEIEIALWSGVYKVNVLWIQLVQLQRKMQSQTCALQWHRNWSKLHKHLQPIQELSLPRYYGNITKLQQMLFWLRIWIHFHLLHHPKTTKLKI